MTNGCGHACGSDVAAESHFCATCGANLAGGMGEVYRAHDLKLEGFRSA